MIPDDKPTGETPETQPPAAGVSGNAAVLPNVSADAPMEEPFDKARAMETINKLRDIEKKAKQDAKELEALRKEKQTALDAELSEAERLKKQVVEIETQNAKLQADILRRDVIAETGLPAAFADRLKGATKDELLADARELLKLIPQSEKQKPPHVPPTNPNNGQVPETDEQKRLRLFGKQSNVFDMNAIREGGGGVVWHNKSEK